MSLYSVVFFTRKKIMLHHVGISSDGVPNRLCWEPQAGFFNSVRPRSFSKFVHLLIGCAPNGAQGFAPQPIGYILSLQLPPSSLK